MVKREQVIQSFTIEVLDAEVMFRLETQDVIGAQVAFQFIFISNKAVSMKIGGMRQFEFALKVPMS